MTASPGDASHDDAEDGTPEVGADDLPLAEPTPAGAPPTKPKRGRLKWEPPAAMVAVLLLGLWLVYSGRTLAPQDINPGASTLPLLVGTERGLVEITPAIDRDADDHASDARGDIDGSSDGPKIRLLLRNGDTVGPLTEAEFAERFGQRTLAALQTSDSNVLFKLFNITNWLGVTWVAIGFLGQAAFFGRMAIQWIISERQRQSVVPPVFWYLSLGGGVLLFIYFVWRQDIVGVTGQTTGIVIYARNIRLIYKERVRERRRTANA